jgi:hypothetical protein
MEATWSYSLFRPEQYAEESILLFTFFWVSTWSHRIDYRCVTFRNALRSETVESLVNCLQNIFSYGIQIERCEEFVTYAIFLLTKEGLILWWLSEAAHGVAIFTLDRHKYSAVDSCFGSAMHFAHMKVSTVPFEAALLLFWNSRVTCLSTSLGPRKHAGGQH